MTKTQAYAIYKSPFQYETVFLVLSYPDGDSFFENVDIWDIETYRDWKSVIDSFDEDGEGIEGLEINFAMPDGEEFPLARALGCNVEIRWANDDLSYWVLEKAVLPNRFRGDTN